MTTTKLKTWTAEVLTFSDFNAEWDNIYDNQGGSLGTPRTTALDMDGKEFILDAGGNTSLTADTANRIDVRANGTDLWRFNGTVSSPVNGVDFVASATTVDTRIDATGTDTNVNLQLNGKGTGRVKVDGLEVVDAIEQIRLSSSAALVVGRSSQLGLQSSELYPQNAFDVFSS